MHALEHRIPPPLIFLLVAAAMWAVARLTPSIPVEDGWRLAIAGAFAALALLFAAPALIALRRVNTTVNPVDIEAASTLVTDGVFRYTRNPMYVALTALLLAWTVWLAAPWAALGPVAFVLFITRFQIVPEERVLRAKFGGGYEDYLRRVRRWI
jgi:protein-S-isoprenylcysteine O-methyltransferase Ste14